MQNFTRALILSGGQPPSTQFIKDQYLNGDFIIAADSGALLAERAELKIDVLLGDFDSLPAESADNLKKSCSRCLTFSRDKDFSDLEAAVRICAEYNINKALILGALGNRLDHSLFNVISILQKSEELGIDAVIADEDCTVFQLNERSITLEDCQGQVISAISLDEAAVLSINGVKWPLKNKKIYRSSTETLSNEITEKSVNLAVNNGRILVIKYKKA